MSLGMDSRVQSGQMGVRCLVYQWKWSKGAVFVLEQPMTTVHCRKGPQSCKTNADQT